MSRTHKVRWFSPLVVVVTSLVAILTLGLIAAAPSSSPPPVAPASLGGRDFEDDPGVDFEAELRDHSRDLFGFSKPVTASANTPSNTEPGDKAVVMAKGLKAKLVSDKVGEDADMIALWPNDDNPTHAIICNEIDGAAPGSPATVQRVRLSNGQVSDMVFGMTSCDPAHRTEWGTIVVGEEAGTSGRMWEILDPLNVNGVTVDRVAGTTSDPARVVARTALGQVSFEGIVLLPDGTTYYGDELRPSTGKPGGGIYKFVPTTPRAAGAGSITNL
ncbi:MAG TPA: hypothetical protein VFO07_08165, partial [Roseiflexaceae bacterium]|nr:hypothetical protein [Roseiflexaceae bacterium]